MSRNAEGRHRLLMTKDHIKPTTSRVTATQVLDDIDQYEFDSLETMEAYAERANLSLLTLQEVYQRAPLHRYEVGDFLQQQIDGNIPRVNITAPREEITLKGPTREEVARSAKKAQAEAEEMFDKAVDDISKAVSGSHYNDVVPGYQYMEMMQHMLDGKEGVESHLLGQVYKYLMRAGKKDHVEQEYRKARWYLNCLVKYKQTGEIDPNNND